MSRKWQIMLLVTLLLSFSSVFAQTPTTPSMDELTALFDYDASLPLDLQEVGVTDHDGVAVHDITFTSTVEGDAPVSAYLVVPPGDGAFAGVLFVNWLGEVRSNREEFLQDALTLAHMGTVSLLVTANWSGFWNRDIDHDRMASITRVIELRRALDLLIAQPNVDPNRLGVVGHDFGAMYGSILAGVDRRANCLCFDVGNAQYARLVSALRRRAAP